MLRNHYPARALTTQAVSEVERHHKVAEESRNESWLRLFAFVRCTHSCFPLSAIYVLVQAAVT